MQIFFSYGHDKHSKVVTALKNEIESQSNGEISVWVDTYKIPRDSHWRERITDGILNSDSVIAFLSSHSAREESVCRDELSIALVSKHGMIRTVLLESLDSFTPPSRVSEYQWADMSDYPKIEEQGVEVFKDYIKDEASKIIKLVTSDDIRRYNDEVKQLRKAFHLPEIDDWTKFDGLIKEELIGREWLFNKIEEWENAPSGGNILMLYGKPGAGKSMFSAHLQMRDSSVVAAFPCDCRRSEYSKTESIILNISYRLALRLPDYRRFVLELLSDSSFDRGSDQLFDRLILNPLSRCNIDGDRAVVVMVVDALDEMDNDELAKFINESADSLREYVRFIITSRKIPSITERFNRFAQIDLDDEEEEKQTRSDLAEYFESRLGTALMDYEEKEAFIEKLIDNSGLVFTYAKCVCDNILKDIENGEFQTHDYPLPHGIEELFKQTLDRSFNCINASYTTRDYEDFWQIPLGMILASPEPLPVRTLKTLMQWKEREWKKFINPLSTLVLCVNECLIFFHKSFGEWLNATNTTYAASREDGISDLADSCYDVYKEEPDSIDEYMLLYTTKFLRENKKRGQRKKYEMIIMDENYIDKMCNYADKLKSENSIFRAEGLYRELLNIFGCEDIRREITNMFLVNIGVYRSDFVKNSQHLKALRGIYDCYEAVDREVAKRAKDFK
ncbi:MAG: toll/interleukin-1 receptor domain-containing protein [Lachnospiraceae bacterium]|nr:toll/interleukin-1 receptor domain-containing protein [Lachnospiraceae bacterium]